ncbi:MAG: hypothetical protein EOM31_00440 [Bacteroidia bacterium]|nr:hypothetical protein [Bacteroidia bacterium]
MKEENKIVSKVGKENAFEVPEGYFESLTSKVMDQLQEVDQVVEQAPEEVSKWTKMKPLFYMAAFFAGAALIIRVASFTQKEDVASDATMANTEVVSDELIDVAVDRAMMDDYSLYVYLTDTSSEE